MHIDQISVSIFDESRKLIYRGLEDLTGDFAKVYNVEKVKGVVRFEVSDRNGIIEVHTK